MAAKKSNTSRASKKLKQKPARKGKKTSRSTSAALTLSVDVLRTALHDMLLIRRFEERAGQLYGLGKIGGFCHLYSGQEAIATGVALAREKGDQIITAYREHGHIIACGAEPKKVMAELLGRASGTSAGKGGSMHMFHLAGDFYGGHGIVGAPAPIGTGIAFANLYKQTDKVCFTFFGDGAANQGQVYESFNMAALWKLPVIYIIENNEYAMGTSVARSSAQGDFSQRGVSFGIQGMQIDGMDIEAVVQAVKEARAHVASGAGPMIIEMKTYRYSGHSMSDPAKYRKREEIKEVRQTRDPIKILQERLMKAGALDEGDFKTLNQDVQAEIEEIVRFAEDAPEPDLSELMSDIYVEGDDAR